MAFVFSPFASLFSNNILRAIFFYIIITLMRCVIIIPNGHSIHAQCTHVHSRTVFIFILKTIRKYNFYARFCGNVQTANEDLFIIHEHNGTQLTFILYSKCLVNFIQTKDIYCGSKRPIHLCSCNNLLWVSQTWIRCIIQCLSSTIEISRMNK